MTLFENKLVHTVLHTARKICKKFFFDVIVCSGPNSLFAENILISSAINWTLRTILFGRANIFDKQMENSVEVPIN